MNDQIQFNKKQLEAINLHQGAVCILAPAGSGKTSTIIERYIKILTTYHLSVDNILMLTFSVKAQRLMKEKIIKRLNEIGYSFEEQHLQIFTFNAFGHKLLKQSGKKIGLYQVNIMLDDERYKLINSILKRLKADNRYHADLILDAIDKFKCGKENLDIRYRVIYEIYQSSLNTMNKIDFTDQIILSRALLRKDYKLKDRLKLKYQYIMVDEYQDTNRIQDELLHDVLNKDENLCVVGDDDQAIYTFRGADPRNILEFNERYKDARFINLEINYRSTTKIVNASKSLIDKNMVRKEKDISPGQNANTGSPINFYHAENIEKEAEFISREILKLYDPYKLSDICILARTNEQINYLNKAFKDLNLNSELVNQFIKEDRKIIEDLLLVLRVINEPNNDLYLDRLLQLFNVDHEDIENLYAEKKHLKKLRLLDMIPQSDNEDLLKIYELITDLLIEKQRMKLFDLIMYVIDRISYLDSLSKIRLKRKEESKHLQSFLNEALLFQNEYPCEDLTLFLNHLKRSHSSKTFKRDRIKLMTIHQSKGLEFPVVFIVGCEERLFPRLESNQDLKKIEEERRLFYVAMTRAKDQLYLTMSGKRQHYIGLINTEESRFANDIDCKFIMRLNLPIENRRKVFITEWIRKYIN
jgi:DNA helicase II / ATP-dependent DNA helicase PcrA